MYRSIYPTIMAILFTVFAQSSDAQNQSERFEASVYIEWHFDDGSGLVQEKSLSKTGYYNEEELNELIEQEKSSMEPWTKRKIRISKVYPDGKVEQKSFIEDTKNQGKGRADEGSQQDQLFRFDRDGRGIFRFDFPGLNFAEEDFLPRFDFDWNDFDHMRWFENPFSKFGRSAYLGISLEDVVGGKGVLVKEVAKDSPAEQADIREGDIILSIDDVPVNSYIDVRRQLQNYQGSDPVKIQLMRGNEELVIFATPKVQTLFRDDNTRMVFPDGPLNFNFEYSDSLPNRRKFRIFPNKTEDKKVRLGVVVETMVNYNGLKVMEVTPGSPADQAGILKYDIIERFDKRKVNQPKELQSLVEDKVGEEVTVQIRRNGKKIKTKVLLR